MSGITESRVYWRSQGDIGWWAYRVYAAGCEVASGAADVLPGSSLADAIAEVVRYWRLPIDADFAISDDDGGYAIWRADVSEGQRKTPDLAVYDLDPRSAELWAVVGPPGWSVPDIDPDALPEGFRWITSLEWGALQAESVNDLIAIIQDADFVALDKVSEIVLQGMIDGGMDRARWALVDCLRLAEIAKGGDA